MMESENPGLPRGLVCPLVTPLKTGDRLDVAALERLIRFAGTGADGFVVGDLVWGEGLELTGDTRAEMARATLELTGGRQSVFVTVTSDTAEQSVALLKKMKAFTEGADYSGNVFWLDYPIYYHSNRGLPQFYEALERETSTPFVLANNPRLIQGRKSRIKHKNIRTSVLKKLSNLPCIRGLVFTGSLKRSINYQKACRHRQGFRLYDGDEGAFIRQPSSDGVVAGGANLLPQPWHEITWSCLNRYDVERQYPDHVSQMWETGAMVQAFYDLYAKQPAPVLKRMLHVAGVLPNAQVASGTPSTDRTQNEAVEAICKDYDLV